ncbi:hypothetical protein A4H97_16510 [Niastella yeongjuensis]|uniref:Cyclic nucleotide-binding domain-containing protein n=1 Tax=Niastella yeongjuensis TaxID=354355 RepID=A0A1V9E115_9BACT|nr:hypothetical protein [Niastella yeongjuensis]OQP39823.1 hypothetical protein A4H97_16510 [Niastella yeongjuensis]SEO06696.1 hypothetical protein SAMN05660816_02049 [Niastella yeongjuensis]
MESLTKHIAALFNLSEENAGIFLSQLSRMELKTNEVFIAEGQVPDRVIKTGNWRAVQFGVKGWGLSYFLAHSGFFFNTML